MPVGATLMSGAQSDLFQEIAKCGDLLLSCGPIGISADIYGTFSVKRVSTREDRLIMGEGTQHVHVDWKRLKSIRVENRNGEGKITFLDGEEPLFAFWRLREPFPDTLLRFQGRDLSGV